MEMMIMISKVILVVHKLVISIIYIAKMEKAKMANQKRKMSIRWVLVRIRITYRCHKLVSWERAVRKIIK